MTVAKATHHELCGGANNINPEPLLPKSDSCCWLSSLLFIAHGWVCRATYIHPSRLGGL